MLGANGEGRGYGNVRQTIVGQNFADNVAANFGRRNPLAHIQVENGAAGIFGLQIRL